MSNNTQPIFLIQGDDGGDLEGSPGRALGRLTLAFSLQPNACATFNFLCHEGRVTGAALIPPPGGTALTSQAQSAE